MQTAPQKLESVTTVADGGSSKAAAMLGIAALLLLSTPYALGYLTAPHGTRFLGQIFIIDDYCVYLSWTHQAVDGHFFARNLFTTDPQRGIEFNVLFLLIGAIARVTHLSVVDILQVARVVAAALLFASIYRLYNLCVPTDRTTRRTAFALVLFGSGLAWLHFLKEQNVGLIYPSADSNQPEAFVFTTAYFAPLAAISTALICEIMRNLASMAVDAKSKYAVAAGLWLLVLGNIHTYDVIHVAAVWTVALIVLFIARKRFDGRLFALSTLAGLIGAPSCLYQLYVLKHETVFFQRAMVATRTPEITTYIFGYGILLVLAILGARAVLKKSASQSDKPEQKAVNTKLLIMICWAIVPFILVYAINVSFQRKLIMGVDIPLCLLAGIGAVWFARRYRSAGPILTAIVLCTVPSTLLFVARDISTLRGASALAGSMSSPYLSPGEQSTLSWIAGHTRPNDAVVAPIRLGILIPGFCDRYVWAAHWGETPNCKEKMRQFSDAFAVTGTDLQRIQLLRASRAQYLCYPNDSSDPSLAEMTIDGSAKRYVDLDHRPPAYLRPVYRNSEYTVFAVSLP